MRKTLKLKPPTSAGKQMKHKKLIEKLEEAIVFRGYAVDVILTVRDRNVLLKVLRDAQTPQT